MALKIDENKVQKREEIIKQNINPYAYHYTQSHHASEINKKYASLSSGEHTKNKASVAGRIMFSIGSGIAINAYREAWIEIFPETDPYPHIKRNDY